MFAASRDVSSDSPAASTRVTQPGDDHETGRPYRSTSDLLRRASAAEPAERQRLLDEAVMINIPLADSVARRYRGRGEDEDDLTQVARMALVQAVRRFDPDRGDFVSFAVPTITGELKRYFRDHAWLVRPPRRIQELQANLSTAWADLAQELGRIPSAPELAEHLGKPVDDISSALAAHGSFHGSSLDSAGGSPDGLHGRLGVDDPEIEQVEIIASLAPLCSQLDAADKKLLYLRFFEQRTQVEIAEALGTNQMAVSRRLSKILGELRDRVTAEAHDHPRIWAA